MNPSVALYIHLPFCRRKCHYCSFTSYQCRETDIPVYLEAVKAELRQRAAGEDVHSIYLGGGTPSLLSSGQISGILDTAGSLFKVEETAEITIEANPGTINRGYLTDIREVGINRLSLGVQSLNDAELALLGRIHSAKDAGDAIHLARGAGFTNINIDLIYGLPGQSLATWQSTLESALEMAPEHLSLYALSLEENTPLWRAIEDGALPSIDPDLSADQYELAEDWLPARGYNHYEISNWAQPRRECRHNLTYWENQPYIGVGVASHSSLNGNRLANTSSLDEYLGTFTRKSPVTPEMKEEIDNELQLAETVILGLRLNEGVSHDSIRRRFSVDIGSYFRRQISELTGLGLLESREGNLKLTRRGRLLSNEVFWRFLPE